MKTFITIIFTFIVANCTLAQTLDYAVNNEIIAYLPDSVEVVGLGDPSHQESTITEYRIDLIKKLVQEKGFRIIAIEGNLFELYQAHQKFIHDGDASHYEQAMYGQLNSKEMEALYRFVYEENQKGNPVCFLGFDARFSGKTYTQKAISLLNKYHILSEQGRKEFINNLQKANITNIKALFRNNKKVKAQLLFYAQQILEKHQAQNTESAFFFQSLKNLKSKLEDNSIKDKDDRAMADNILFLQQEFPKEKIILFGSSTHLLKKPKAIQTEYFQSIRTTTMGNELYKKLGNQYYCLAYSALSGHKFSFFSQDQTKPIAAPIEASVESGFMNKDGTAFFVSKNALPTNTNTPSRFLGHDFVFLDLQQVVDGMVLIKDVESCKIKSR